MLCELPSRKDILRATFVVTYKALWRTIVEYPRRPRPGIEPSQLIGSGQSTYDTGERTAYSGSHVL